MSERLKSIFSERTILYIMVLFMAVGLGMFIFVQSSVTTFKADNIRRNMIWMGNSIKYFCSAGYDQLAKVGAVDDEIQVLLKQAEILEMVEDFSRNNEFKVEVYEAADVSFVLLLSSFSNVTAKVKDPMSLPLYEVSELMVADQVYASFVIPFEAWNWRVVLLRDARSYNNLLEKLRGFYLVMGGLVLMLTLVIIFFLRYSRESSKVLQMSQERLQDTLDSLAEGVIVVNFKGLVTQINPSAKKILGMTEGEDCFYKHIGDILVLQELDKDTAVDKADFEQGGVFYEKGGKGEYRLLDVGDEDRHVQVRFTRTSSGLMHSRKESLVLSLNDVTQKKQIEHKLQQAQKMEVVGLMAGGVAHDLNNILSGILSYPELVLLKLDKDSDLRKPIDAIRKSGQRAAAVVADLLTVARGAASTRDIVDVNVMIDEYLQSPECQKLQQHHPEITMQLMLAPEIAAISCSPVHVKKCLLNLILNGFEVIEGPGTCTIRTRMALVGKQQAERLQISAGKYVIVAVADDGPGIDGDDIAHIFEPFYTKKKMGRSGTGLGLSVVWNTMLDHNGTVVVQSGVDGTVFELYFPAAGCAALPESEEVPYTDFSGSGQSILLVDDDPMQRSLGIEFLTELNYRAEAVASGEEAIEKVSRNQYDLLLLDMIMDPGISGRTTYEKILEIQPNQKAIIVSGFSESEEVRATMALGAGWFVKKPYSLAELGHSVRVVLGA